MLVQFADLSSKAKVTNFDLNFMDIKHAASFDIIDAAAANVMKMPIFV